MSNKNQSIESPVKKLQITQLGRISRIILELEPLADIYERHGTVTFKVCSELLAEFRALERGLLENPQRELKLSDIYRRTFTGTFVGDRQALLKVGPYRTYHRLSKRK
jgi:hypothetical protein